MKISPFWWHDLGSEKALEIAPAPLPEKADVVVVGAGFTGISAALTFIRHGRSVVVLDRGQPGLGASTRNGGICSGNLRVKHAVLKERHGLDHANRIYAEAVDAREDLRQFIENENIDCSLKRSGWLLGAMSQANYETLSREAEALNAIPGHDIEMLPRDQVTAEMNSPRFYGGMLRREIDSFHPARFFAGLLEIAEREGVVICPDRTVMSIDDDGSAGGKIVRLAEGSIRAGKVMVATNGYTGRQHAFSQFVRQRLVPVQSAIIVTEKLGRARVGELFPGMRSSSTTAHLSAYFRPTPNGERILLGSRSFDRLQPSRRTVIYLKRLLTDLFPQLHDVGIDYCWLGNVAFTRTHLPAIFTRDDVTYSCGYAGSGTVWARWLGRKAAEECLGMTNSPSVFSGPPPETIPFYDGDPWFMPLVTGYYASRDMLNEWRFGQRN